VNAPPHAVAERLARGDERALEECYRVCGPLVRAYVGKFLPTSEIDDVVQLTFLGLWQARERLDAGRPVEPLLFSIARRKAIDSLRRKRNVVEVAVLRDLMGQDGDRLVDQLVCAAEVRTALAELSAEQRQAIELVYFEQLSLKEIAQRLEVPLGTVKARVSRGISRLGAILEQGGNP
jgi:RNA polymerase sigma factor (sigma-70 family)